MNTKLNNFCVYLCEDSQVVHFAAKQVHQIRTYWLTICMQKNLQILLSSADTITKINQTGSIG